MADNNGSFNRYSHVRISLKPHYYFNNDQHNGNQLTTENAIFVLNEIAEKLNIKNYAKLKPTALDFGVNLIPEENDSKDIVTQTLYYKKKPLLFPHSHLPFYKTTFPMGSSPTIGIKMYHKGLQYAQFIHENTLRYETAFKTSRKLESQFGIKTFADLFQFDLYGQLSHYLSNTWQYLLILDEVSENNDLFNPNYYEEKRHFRNGLSIARKEYYKQYGYLRNELKKLLDYALEENNRKMQIPTLIDSLNLHNIEENDIVGICTQQNKVCDVTGIDISMQKDSSKNLFDTGVEFYFYNHPEVYQKLVSKYLTRTKRNADLQTQFRDIAHNIRNAKSNKIHNRKRFEQRNYHPNQLQFQF